MTSDRADEIMRHLDLVAERLRSEMQVLVQEIDGMREKIEAFRHEVAGEFLELRSVVRFP